MDCFKEDTLYHVFHSVMRLHYKRSHMLFEKVGIYPGQPALLISLSVKDGQSQKDLAHRLGIKAATVTVMLNRMEKSGFIRRSRDSNDRRVLKVYLTDKGRDVSRKIHDIVDSMSLECFDNFTQEEKILLRRLFMQMRDNLINACHDTDIQFK